MTNTEKTNSAAVTTATGRALDVLSIRRMKVYPFYRQSRSIHVCKPQAKVLPLIRLCGDWLQQAGFAPDADVSVTVMKGILIVKPTQEV